MSVVEVLKKDEGMMEPLMPKAERMWTRLCLIEAGPFALEMTQFPQPCDEIIWHVLGQNSIEQVPSSLQEEAT